MSAALAALGGRLRQLRQARGVSQSELARRTSAARTYVVAIEQGRHEPSVELLRRVATALDYTLPDLIRHLAGAPFTDPAAPLGQRVRLRREALGISASQIAARAETTRATISQIESGVNANPGLVLLTRLAHALHCCPSELVPAGEAPPPTPPPATLKAAPPAAPGPQSGRARPKPMS